MADHEDVKIRLQAKLKELTARAQGIEDDLATKPESDWGDNAIESEDDEVLASLGEVTIHDIHEIKLALSRIESGQYGTCTTCARKISPARLEVLPFATTCVDCA